MSFVFMNEDFFMFINNFSYCSFCITVAKCFRCPATILLKTSMSYKYTMKNFPMNSLRTSFINLMKVLGAFVKPNDITSHSYKP
jgi:hypothetical protein